MRRQTGMVISGSQGLPAGRQSGMIHSGVERKGGGQRRSGHRCLMGRWPVSFGQSVSPHASHYSQACEGSSGSLGNTGSGCSNAKAMRAALAPADPHQDEERKTPGSPDQQTPTLEGCTEKPTLAAAPAGVAGARRVRRPGEERHLVTGCRAPDSGGALRLRGAGRPGLGRGGRRRLPGSY